MCNTPTIYFILIVILTLIVEQISLYFFNLIKGSVKYQNITGTYLHDNGQVKVSYINKNLFKTIGIENSGRKWMGSFTIDGNIGIGNYKWEDKNDWGFHELYISENTISVTWINKSHPTFNQGTLVWTKKTKR